MILRNIYNYQKRRMDGDYLSFRVQAISPAFRWSQKIQPGRGKPTR